jgi:hypothetical protein
VVRRLLAAAALLLAAGCGAGDPPQVVFRAAEATVTARPAQYCDLKLTDCDADAGAPVRLAVPVGTPLQVDVPDDVAQAPWHVVFRYRDAAGQEDEARSPVFAKKERGYTLTLPADTDRLIHAEVQQFGPAPKINEQTGEVEFPVRGTWVLDTTG